MRRLAYVAAACAVLLVAALAYLSAKVSDDAVLRAAAEKIGALTGYGVEIHGTTRVALFPLPGFEIGDIVLVRPFGAREEVASIDVLRGSVALLPLLVGHVVLRDFTLERPRLELIIDRRGEANWSIARRGEIGASAGAPAEDAALIPDIRVGSFRVVDGTIAYVNRRTGTRQDVSAISAAVSWPRLAAPLEAAGTVIWNGEPVRFALGADAPLAFLGQGTSPARIRLESGVVNVDFNGNAHHTPDLQFEGAVRLAAPSVRGLLRWLGADPGSGPGLDAVALSGTLNLIDRSMSLSNLSLSLDGNEAEGVAKITLGERRTDVQGTLAFEALDLGKYRSPPADAAATSTPAAPAGAMARAIDLAPLDRITADLRLSAASVTYGALSLGRTAGTVTVRKGAIDIGLGEATLYGGTAQGTLVAAPAPEGAHVKASVKLDKVDIGPLLTAISGNAPISGLTTARVSLAGTGRTLGEIVAGLSGEARLDIGPGAIEGIDVGSLLAALETGLVEGWPPAPARTVVDRLTATFKVDKGNAATDDFSLRGPNVEVLADGEVRLISASIAGHGTADLGPEAGRDAAVLSVPFVIEGPIANPVLYPDPVWLLDRAAATPEEVERTRKDLRQSSPEEVVEDIVQRGRSLLPRLPPQETQPTTPQQ